MQNLSKHFKIDFDHNRIYGLDILRTLAILFVVVGHACNLLFDKINKSINYFMFDGVSIFFVLSGYLIGGVLLKTLTNQPASFKSLFNFWKRRWLRTIPAYFIVLIILIFLSHCFSKSFNFIEALKYFVFVQNFYSVHPSFFPEAWSLSIEEWFYILIPFVIFLQVIIFNLNPKKSFLITIILVIVYSFFYRYYRYSQLTFEDLDVREKIFSHLVITRLDNIMIGAIGAYIMFYYKLIWLRYKGICFILGLILFLILKLLSIYHLDTFGIYLHVFYFTTGAIATLLLLPLLSELKSGKGFLYKFITYISVVSYSMYLINLTLVQNWFLNCINLFNFSDKLFTILSFVLFWFFTFIATFILYKFCEWPFIKLRTKLTIVEK